VIIALSPKSLSRKKLCGCLSLKYAARWANTRDNAVVVPSDLLQTNPSSKSPQSKTLPGRRSRRITLPVTGCGCGIRRIRIRDQIYRPVYGRTALAVVKMLTSNMAVRVDGAMHCQLEDQMSSSLHSVLKTRRTCGTVNRVCLRMWLGRRRRRYMFGRLVAGRDGH
jgi:hypothetical protein